MIGSIKEYTSYIYHHLIYEYDVRGPLISDYSMRGHALMSGPETLDQSCWWGGQAS
jgi:hypothetical protein